jgi:hypothetical protein
MQLLESVADKLAREALATIDYSDDNILIDDMAEVMGASSSTLQEAFLTAVRIRRAEARAQRAHEKFKSKQKAATGGT